jgi:hypothetical protein
MGRVRTQLVGRLRKELDWGKYTSAIRHEDETTRKGNTLLETALGYDSEENLYPRFPPIFYEDPENTVGSGMFKNVLLPPVRIIMLLYSILCDNDTLFRPSWQA